VTGVLPQTRIENLAGVARIATEGGELRIGDRLPPQTGSPYENAENDPRGESG
jgi:hypothetical protein